MEIRLDRLLGQVLKVRHIQTGNSMEFMVVAVDLENGTFRYDTGEEGEPGVPPPGVDYSKPMSFETLVTEYEIREG